MVNLTKFKIIANFAIILAWKS